MKILLKKRYIKYGNLYIFYYNLINKGGDFMIHPKNLDEINKQIEMLENKIKDKYDNGVYGTFVDRYIICGKEGCKCLQGYKHGPYPHIQVYDKNKILRGIYIGNKKYESYKKKLDRNKEFYEIIKELNKLYILKRKLKL